MQLIGWLLKRPQNSEVVFGTFEKIWEDLYHYVVQDLNPKMDVSIEVYDYFAITGCQVYGEYLSNLNQT